MNDTDLEDMSDAEFLQALAERDHLEISRFADAMLEAEA